MLYIYYSIILNPIISFYSTLHCSKFYLLNQRKHLKICFTILHFSRCMWILRQSMMMK